MEAEFDRMVTSLTSTVETTPDANSMESLVRALAHRPVPTSRLARLWTMGTTQLGVMLRSMSAWARGALSSKEKRELIRHEAQIRSALKVLRMMGYLRGAMAKVGQALHAYPQVGPEHLGDVLGALNCEAPPMHFALLREQFAAELGDDPGRVFAAFDPQACAAASLGQVHRARLHGGGEVAVKIQYPNIARTIQADLGTLQTLMAPLRLSKEWAPKAALVRDIKSTFLRETDYLSEAEFAERARRHLADLEDIRIPHVHRALTTSRVLTMEYLEGVHLEELLEQGATQDTKNKHGAQIFRAMCRLLYSGKMIHADPNPGNFLFLPDGSLGLLDFGCCRVLSEDEADYFEQGTRDFVRTGSPSDAILQRGALLSQEEMQDKERMGTLRAAVCWLWEPMNHDAVFAFDDAYLDRGMGLLKRITDKRYTRTTPINTWSNRMFYGIRIVLHRLDARFNAKAIHDDELRRAGYMPS